MKVTQQKRRCDYCNRAVATTDHLTGAVVYGIHSPPGGGYCPNSHQPVPARKREKVAA